MRLRVAGAAFPSAHGAALVQLAAQYLAGGFIRPRPDARLRSSRLGSAGASSPLGHISDSCAACAAYPDRMKMVVGRPGRRRLCLVPLSPDISETRESRAPRTVALSTRFRLHSMRLSRAVVCHPTLGRVHESFDRALRDARRPQVADHGVRARLGRRRRPPAGDREFRTSGRTPFVGPPRVRVWWM